MKTELLCIQRVSKKMNQSYELDLVSFSAFKGEVLGVVGLNDSGIYALANLLSGNGSPDSGEVYIDDKPVVLSTRAKARKYGLYYIESLPKLVPGFTVPESMYITDPPVLHSSWVSVKAMAVNTQRIFGEYGVDIDINKRTYQLTRCEQNIVEIMRAVTQNVKVIIIDNILANYNQSENNAINRLIRKLTKNGMAVVIIGTEFRHMMDVTDRIIVLRTGRVEGVFYRADYDERIIYSALAQKDIAPNTVVKYKPDTKTGLEMRGLAFGDYEISKADFTIRAGEVVGFVDKNGRGFKRIINILNGEEACGGEIILRGQKLSLKNRSDAVKAGIGYLNRHDLQNTVFSNLTLGENIMLIKYPEYSRAGFINMKMCDFAAKEYIRIYDLPPEILHKYPDEVGAHVTTMIPLIKWIALRPKVMLLNDPFAGVDVIIQNNIYTFINYLRENSVSIVFCSPVKSERDNVCDRIYVIDRGRVWQQDGSGTAIS